MENAKKTGPRDVFLHLAVMLGLYVTVIAFGSLIFQLINVGFPDPLFGSDCRGGCIATYSRQALRWPLAVLVVVFPLYVWLTAFLQKELAAIPEKRGLKTRRWLLYFTLFAASLVMVGDLISLIFRFLEGEFTIRFILKVLTVLLIAGAAFLYYGWNLKKEMPASQHPKMKFFVRGVVALVGIAMAGGFFVAGSPQSERLRRFDEQRMWHLQSIQSEIVSYWQSKQKLPQTIGDLADPLRGFVEPRDPEPPYAPYEYRPTGKLSFELCATFKTSNMLEDKFFQQRFKPVSPEPVFVDEVFLHNAERTCFARTIDPDRFPPFKK